MNSILSRKTLLALLVLIVIAVLVGLVAPRELPKKEPVASSETTVPFQVTVIGKMVCLPHTDTTGPVTLECAYGLQTPDGAYYALDLSQVSEPIDSVAMTENSVIVDGMYSPIELISSDQWQKYNIQGIIQASDISVVSAAEQTL